MKKAAQGLQRTFLSDGKNESLNSFTEIDSLIHLNELKQSAAEEIIAIFIICCFLILALHLI